MIGTRELPRNVNVEIVVWVVLWERERAQLLGNRCCPSLLKQFLVKPQQQVANDRELAPRAEAAGV